MPELLTPEEAAELLRTTPAALAQARYRGIGVPFKKLGKRVFYTAADIARYLDEHTYTRTDQPVVA